MKSIDSTLVHRVLLPEHSSSSTHPALLMLHGRGADEEDLSGLASFLDDRLLILSARAPYPFPHGGYTWFDVGATGAPGPEMFKTSYDLLSAFIHDALEHYPIDAGRFFLFGFSMGTVMSYALALAQPELFKGVMANSGYVPEGTHLTLHWQGLAQTEFCITHGTEDPVIPVALARRAKALFDQSNAAVSYREYPMAHEISQKSLHDVGSWLHQRIATTH